MENRLYDYVSSNARKEKIMLSLTAEKNAITNALQMTFKAAEQKDFSTAEKICFDLMEIQKAAAVNKDKKPDDYLNIQLALVQLVESDNDFIHKALTTARTNFNALQL